MGKNVVGFGKIMTILAVIMLLATAIGEAKTVYFKLDPSDPHWVKKEDPEGLLQDLGYAWKSNGVAGQIRPEIYFKLPEVSSSKGILTFTWSKEESPDYIGWDSLELYASEDGATWTKIWENSKKMGYVPPTEVSVVIPEGYVNLKFKMSDGNLPWEYIVLYKDMTLEVEVVTPTPTPTPTPTTPAPAPKVTIGVDDVVGYTSIATLAIIPLALAILLRWG